MGNLSGNAGARRRADDASAMSPLIFRRQADCEARFLFIDVCPSS